MSLRNKLKSVRSEDLFQNTWGKAVNDSYLTKEMDANGTLSVKEIIKRTPEHKEKYENHTAKAIGGFRTKAAMTMSGISSAVPIIFDPEIISLLSKETPFLDAVDQEGYQGYTVRANNISARADPIGHQAEADVLSLSDTSNITISTVSSDMEITVDQAQISDFGQMGSQHYMNLRDTTLGERIAAFLQLQEQTLLYGDSSSGGTGGSPYDADSFNGLAKIYEDQGTDVDRSAVSSGFLEDIKGYIYALLQSTYSITTQDLLVFCSYTMYDALEADATSYGRWEINDERINYGGKRIHIAGVPVIPGHNIRGHTFNSTSVGDDGDVFIVNKRAAKMKYLAPLSIIPLARDGLAENVGLFEFSTLIDRADGLFGRYLKEYNI